ncbi:uncharacterized protein BDZ99DRAFT_525409 [Mytilinidion resinicola]|uniref:Late endosomal/lysosomal adaptor and MAPK and MTOR activator-domain-containing protein n=1 Tax=Mytilinidion resinicola TaxID=574789 RepID=A0A6A6Y9C1_9PEZI|nr:uncharacterized protein BDZ99DRAFT_525409 [Mytilinidion resinicola]KAF2804574.1 hypothetical protein BDZ99DRAFT_525409 [Mytilinidion resinicola]
MGICSSCIGRRASQSDRSDSSHLLIDPYQPHYGSMHTSGPHGRPQPDPEEIRRQRDTLERICAQTSDKLIDVSHSAYTEEGSKMTSEYPRLFMERFPPPKVAVDSRPSSSGTGDGEQDEATWLMNTIGGRDGEEPSWDRVEPIDGGTLTVQFDEALGLDRRQGGRA